MVTMAQSAANWRNTWTCYRLLWLQVRSVSCEASASQGDLKRALRDIDCAARLPVCASDALGAGREMTGQVFIAQQLCQGVALLSGGVALPAMDVAGWVR